MANQFYTEKQILHRIRQLHRKGTPLNIAAVKRQFPNLLFSAFAQNPFLGWKQAIERAGIDYAEIEMEIGETLPCPICGSEFANLINHVTHFHHLTRDSFQEKFPKSELMSERSRINKANFSEQRMLPHWEPFWTPEYVLDRLYAFDQAGVPMRFTIVSQIDGGLSNALTDYKDELGGWLQILDHLGIKPASKNAKWRSASLSREFRKVQRGTKYPSAVSVKNAIRERDGEGLPMNSTRIQKGEDTNRALFDAACRFYGDWESALRESGLDADSIVLTRQKLFSDEDVIKTIQKLHREGAPLNHASIIQKGRAGLASSATKRFGSWDKALEAAGFEPEEFRLKSKRYPDKESIVSEIQRRHSEDLSLRPVDLRTEDSRLYRKAGQFFENWYEALQKAGLDASKIVRKPPTSPKS